MGGIQRVGDQDSAGGRILQGEPSVRVNGLPVAVENKMVSTHPDNSPLHSCAKTRANINKTVRANGQLIVVTGDTDTCGHKRVGGSTNVRIG